jgi:hypothetical protein
MTDAPEDRATAELSHLRDQLMHELYPEFSERVAQEPMEELIAAELARWDSSKVRDFVPIFVRRRVRAQLRDAEHAATA